MKSNIRIIARLDVKAPNLIKGVHLEGLRKVGDPREFAERYYHEGIDEIIYIDMVASLYNRNTIIDLVRETARNVFVPITAGGGIRSVDDARALLRAGADKVSVNTAATKSPELITGIAKRFGSQCMVLYIEAKRHGDKWEAYCDNGREPTGLDAVEWAVRGQELEAGEILVTSIDQEGTRSGFDLDLIRQISTKVTVPVIASGGMGKFDHLAEAVSQGKADAVAIAHMLHYEEITIGEIREQALQAGMNVRPVQCLT